MFESLLDVRATGASTYINVTHRENFRSTVFGGQVLAQALMSAMYTVEDRPPHSIHAYFLRAGHSDTPIEYAVERIRDGRSISSRRVVAMQDDRPIFHLSASFHAPEKGYEHQVTAPVDIPAPETLLSVAAKNSPPPEHGEQNNESSPFTLLAIPADLFTSCEKHAPNACFWIKTNKALAEPVRFHFAALAFASDLGLLATSVLPHPTSLFSKDIFAASIDHAMWFHDDSININEWLLCEMHSPWAGNARGFTQARIFSQQGKLLVSTTQEGLIRPINYD